MAGALTKQVPVADLPHEQFNRELGLPGGDTDDAEVFMASLDPSVAGGDAILGEQAIGYS